MDITAVIINDAKELGFNEAVHIPVDDIRCHPKFYTYCKENLCGSYTKNWACPQSDNVADEWNEKLKAFSNAVLVQTTVGIPDGDGSKAYLGSHSEHHTLFRKLVSRAREYGRDIQPLSAEFCVYCEKCTCPEEPCRFPDMCFPAIEGVGMDAGELCRIGGIPFGNFSSVITFLSLILIK